MLLNNQIHRVGFFIDFNSLNLGGCHGIEHQLGWIFGPQKHVDLLAANLARNTLNPGTLDAYARTYCVDSLVVGTHRNFCATPRRACNATNLYYVFMNFWNLALEKFDEHTVMSARQHEVLTAVLSSHIDKVRLDLIFLMKNFSFSVPDGD